MLKKVEFGISDSMLYHMTVRTVLDYATRGERAYVMCNLGYGETMVEFDVFKLGDLMWKITDTTGKVWEPTSRPKDLAQLEATLVHLGHDVRDQG